MSKAASEIKLSLPRLFLVGARGPVRDKLQAGERAHHNATALAGKPGCQSTIWRSINTLSSRRLSTSTTGTVTTGVDQPNIHDHENNELSHVPVSDSDVSLGNLYSGSSPSTSLVSGKRGIRRDYSSSAIVEALVSNVDPVTGDIPTEVLTMLWHVDLFQGVEAIVAVLEREQRQQMSN